MNKEDLEKLQQKFKDLTETSKKYTNMGYEKSSIIEYRKPNNEFEEEFVKKVNNRTFIYLLLFMLIFLAFLIFSIITKAKISVIIIMGLMVILAGYLAFRCRRTNDLMIGKAVYKERHRNTNKKKHSYNYYVSVADEDKKVIYTRVQISKKEFDLVEEGTPILISKGSHQGYIYEE